MAMEGAPRRAPRGREMVGEGLTTRATCSVAILRYRPGTGHALRGARPATRGAPPCSECDVASTLSALPTAPTRRSGPSRQPPAGLSAARAEALGTACEACCD